jgi:hypothetical protein
VRCARLWEERRGFLHDPLKNAMQMIEFVFTSEQSDRSRATVYPETIHSTICPTSRRIKTPNQRKDLIRENA